METKHTPGPWHFSGEITNVTGTDLYVGNVFPDITGYRGDICSIQSCDHLSHGNGISRSEAKANAKLIAAAPELLEALKTCEEVLWMHTPEINKSGFNPNDAINKAKQAIKKATS